MKQDYVIRHSVIRQGEFVDGSVLGSYSTHVDALNKLIEFSDQMYPYYEKFFIDAFEGELYRLEIVLSFELNAFAYLVIYKD